MKKTIKNYKIKKNKVIIRCDFNVPIKNGVIEDDTRIKAALKTIKYARRKGAKIILLSHLGKVKTIEDKEKLTLRPVAIRLSQLLGKEVEFVPHCTGEEVEKAIDNMKPKSIIMLENTRFMDLDGKKESSNDKQLGQYWASLADLFVNDAFGTVHREHASNVGISSSVDSCIGFLIESELLKLKSLDNPDGLYVVVMGGAKISDKLSLIENLLKKADKILIGGAMANTFFKAQGYNVGKSLYEESYVEYCQNLLNEHPDKLVLPIDVNNGLEYNADTVRRTSPTNLIRANEMALDIGPETVELFKKILNNAEVIVMNGPLGVFEFLKFNNGTREIVKHLSKSRAKVIIGGGDSASAVNKFSDSKLFYHVSTGGGAALTYLEGKSLPGIEVINEK